MELQVTDTHPEFEALARAFLARHPRLRHEWREIRNAWWGGRTDLVCEPGSPDEVFASLTHGQITVGDKSIATDIEDFGRGLTGDELAREAFEEFLKYLSHRDLLNGD